MYKQDFLRTGVGRNVKEQYMAGEPAAGKSVWKSKCTYIVIALFVISLVKACASPQFYVPHWEKIEEFIVVAVLAVAGVMVFISVKGWRKSEGERATGNSWWKSKLTFRNFVLLLLVYFSSKACGVHQFYGPYWGVVEDETGRPIEGAGVIMHYKKECASPGGTGPGPFVGVQSDFTDEDGDFFLWPRFFIQMPQPICFFKWDPELYVLKEGYQVAEHRVGYTDAEVWWRSIGSPITFGGMDFQLKELGNTERDYGDYSLDISDSLYDSEHYWMLGDTKKYVEMANKEEEWAINMEKKMKMEEEARRRYRQQFWGIE
jgi:hypothetical protein